MPEQNSADSLNREKMRLRMVGAIILATGIISAGLVYWLGMRNQNAGVEQYEQARERSEARQMELLYGKSGDLTADFFSALKRPGPQAIAIMVFTGLISGACFYLGRPLDEA